MARSRWTETTASGWKWSDAELKVGGQSTIKFKESLSGRLADALIHLYLASAVLKRYEDDGRPAGDLPMVQWALDDSLRTIQDSLYGVLCNFPVPLMGGLLRLIVFPWGRRFKAPSDAELAMKLAVLRARSPPVDVRLLRRARGSTRALRNAMMMSFGRDGACDKVDALKKELYPF